MNKAEIARRGLSLASVQEVIGTAIGGRDAGVVFEGDRHFDIVVRLADAIRNDLDALKNLAGITAVGRNRPFNNAFGSARRVHLWRGSKPDQPRERQAPRGRDCEHTRSRYRVRRQ